MSETVQVLENVDREGVMQVLPHRDPFLLIDRVERCEVLQHCIAHLKLTGEEDFFRGHFPGKPVMPGVLQLESLAQCGAFAVLAQPGREGTIALFAKADNVKFRRQVIPGDELRLEVSLERVSRVGGKGKGVATVNGETSCEADITFVFAKDE